jgi:hypothetical protein
MSVQLPPNSTGQVVDTITTVAGKERGVAVPPNGGQFNLYHNPAAATQATVTQAAGAAGVKNVATGLSYSISTVGTAQTVLSVSLRDGATGAGTILWSAQFILPVNTTLQQSVVLPHIAGSAATAMTVESSAAGVAASVISVTLQGYTTA